jgi:hypothetical protein
MKKKIKPAPAINEKPKQAYIAPQITIVKIDHEISLSMASSESPFPPLEMLHIKL